MVIIGAPYTSKMDLIITIASHWKEGLNTKALVSKKFTIGFFGAIVKWLGGISVDKSNYASLAEFTVSLFNENPELFLLIIPEGTRKRVDKWNTIFYDVAKAADVPLCLSTLDYKKKKSHIFEVYNVTGDFERCMAYIEKQYEKANPKYPKNYNKKIF